MAAVSPMMSLYKARDAVAVVPTLLVIAALIGMQYDRAVVVHYKDEKKPVEVKLIDAAPEPEKPKPQPPEPTPPTPQKPQVAQPQPQQSSPAQATPAPAVVTTSAPSAVSAPEPTVASVPAPKAVEQTPPAPPPKPVAANLEGDYVAKVRGFLNASKRYPTGREASLQHPKGTVKLWFVLKRDGSLVDSGIEESSNSMLLDDAARKTVNRASYPAFPEASYPGEATHRFTTELEFIPPN